jgi:hypothetical protein
MRSETVGSPLPAPVQPDVLVAQGFWVCGACRSVNRREAKRCYGCKTAVEPTDQPLPVAQPVRELVPVMAEGAAVSSDGAAMTTALLAAPWTNAPTPNAVVGDPEPVLTAAQHEVPAGVAVCPVLGFRNDPSTRCDFPDPRNLCHAAPERGATSFASPRRFIPGRAGSMRSEEIGASHQKSVCLTTAH